MPLGLSGAASRVVRWGQPFTITPMLTRAALLLALTLPAAAQSALTTDPPPDKLHPATMQTFQIPSHGSLLNALAYIPSGAAPHPVVLLLHGFPGNEKNLDLAQILRRAGYTTVFFNYRGSWGTPGDFSFTHCMEDTQSALLYLRANAALLHANPADITLIGHSMGGFMAVWAAAHDPAVSRVVLISAADMAARAADAATELKSTAAARPVLAKALAEEGLAPLAGTTPDALAGELLAHPTDWVFPSLAPGIAPRPILILTSDDGLAPYNQALLSALTKAGDHQATFLHLSTDHSYSDQRIALAKAILAFLN